MANATDKTVSMTLDLPFYTTTGAMRTTGKSASFSSQTLTQSEETCRPQITVAAQSVATVLFVRSRDRQVSNMKGSSARFDRLDDMKTTNSNFGTTYQMSGKTKTFDASNPLISSRTTTSSGYVQLDNRYSQLIMNIKKVTTTSSLTAGAPTLRYINSKGTVVTHEYERLDLSKGENFNIVLE